MEVKPIVPLTAQQVFDNALFGIRQQKYQRSERTSTCMYRADRTAKCPVRCGIGHSIPDALYDPAMEGKAIDHLLTRIAGERLVFLFEGVGDSLLADLQHAHDRELSFGAHRFEKAMATIAANYGLTYTAPEAA